MQGGEWPARNMVARAKTLPGHTSEMITETIQSDEQFLSMREKWNALLQCSASDGVFLTHEWLSSWWRHLGEGRQLSIVTARENGELIGILPVVERGTQVARMMP